MDMPARTIVRMGKLELHFLVEEPKPDKTIVMFEFVIPPDARVPAPHYHVEVDEVLYALGGIVTSTVNGQKHELRPGDTLFIPRGATHTHENLHGETARTLVVMTPGTIDRSYFEAMAAEVNVPGKPDLERMKKIMLSYGLVPV